jgi:hypothetical protein
MHPCGYYSKSHLPAERNYENHDREMLAIIKALKHWQQHLEGAKFPIIIKSDNSALQYFMTNCDLSRRQAHWALYLSRFDFKIEYTASKTIKADGLSWRVDLQLEEKDNIQQTLLPSHFLLLIDIQTYGTVDDYCRKKIEDASSGWTRANRLAYTEKGQLYVPNNPNTRKGLVREAHDPGHVGHLGVKKSYELLSRDYYWPGMHTDIESYIKTCPVC